MKKKKNKVKEYLPLYLMMLPGLLYLLINNYLPMTGIILAFKKLNFSGKKEYPFRINTVSSVMDEINTSKNGKIIVNVITISIRLIQNWYLFVFFEFVIMDSPPKTMLCLYLHV